MFKWLKRLFKEPDDEFEIRVGNGPKQEGSGGYGWSGHIPIDPSNTTPGPELLDSIKRLQQSNKELEAALQPKTSSEPIVWAPVNTTITPEPAVDVTPSHERNTWIVDAPKPKKERKPKKLNKGLAKKAKKAKTTKKKV